MRHPSMDSMPVVVHEHGGKSGKLFVTTSASSRDIPCEAADIVILNKTDLATKDLAKQSPLSSCRERHQCHKGQHDCCCSLGVRHVLRSDQEQLDLTREVVKAINKKAGIWFAGQYLSHVRQRCWFA